MLNTALNNAHIVMSGYLHAFTHKMLKYAKNTAHSTDKSA